MAALKGTTSWPEAMPDVEDLPHSAECTDCQGSDGAYLDVDCHCGYMGSAPIVEYTYTVVLAHCPECGEHHGEARDPDWKDFL